MRSRVTQLVAQTAERLRETGDRIRGRNEADRASRFWGSLADYHEQNDADENLVRTR